MDLRYRHLGAMRERAMCGLRKAWPSLSVLVIVIISLSLFIHPLENSRTAPMAPDEVVNSYFATVYAETGDLTFENELTSIDPLLFRPRNTVPVEDGIATGKFLGMPIISGTVERFLGSELSVYTVPFLAALSLVFFFSMVRREFGLNVALVSTALVSVASSFWYWSTMYWFEDAMAIFFLFGGIDHMLRGTEEGESRALAVASLFFGMALLIKPFFGAAILPMVVLIALSRRFTIPRAVVSIAPFIAMGALFLMLNQTIYGNPISTGYSETWGGASNVIESQLEADLSEGVEKYIDLFIFFFPISAFGLMGLLDNALVRGRQRLALFLVLAGGVVSFYILVLSGTDQINSIHHSVVRYLMFIQLLMVPFAVLLMFRLPDRKRVVAGLMVLTIVLANVAVVSSVDNIMDTRNRYGKYDVWMDGNVPKDSVLICQYADKMYFPTRLTANPAFIPKEHREATLVNASAQLLDLGHHVFFLKDQMNLVTNVTLFEALLQEKGLQMTTFHAGMGFYSITQVPQA